jgi:archaellum biogenesis ATPase FlaH
MKKILFISFLFFTSLYVSAQKGSWIIRLNNKQLLSTRQEDAVKNVKKIKAADWKKSGKLEILFKEDEKDMWMRSFLLVDESDNEILRADSTLHASISLAELRRLFAGKKQLVIYTTISPLDPNLAIRIRRVHLCTLQLP